MTYSGGRTPEKKGRGGGGGSSGLVCAAKALRTCELRGPLGDAVGDEVGDAVGDGVGDVVRGWRRCLSWCNRGSNSWGRDVLIHRPGGGGGQSGGPISPGTGDSEGEDKADGTADSEDPAPIDQLNHNFRVRVPRWQACYHPAALLPALFRALRLSTGVCVCCKATSK